MKQTIWTGTCAAIVSLATTGILAQATPQTPSAPQTPAPQAAPSSSDQQKVTVTGCLKAAPQMANNNTADAAGTSGTAGTTATAGTSGSAGTTAGGSTGTTGAATPGTAGAPAEPKFLLTSATASPADAAGAGASQTFRLIANPAALNDHIGKKLELTGTIDKASTPDPTDPSASAPALRVESGKIVAASCSE